MDDIELSAPLPRLPARDGTGGVVFDASLCLIRLHRRPLGLIEVELGREGVGPDQLAAAIDDELGAAVAAHLRQDGLEPLAVTADGIAGPDAPRCGRARERMLQNAPSLSVVIPTLGRPQRVMRTLRSILACRYPPERLEAIVVDTPLPGAAPLQLPPLGDGAASSVRVVAGPAPGTSLARNTGLREASGEIVVFADDDVDVDRDWLATLVAGFELGSGVAAVSGPTLPRALETPTERWFQGFGGLVRGFEPRVYSLENPPVDQPLFPFIPGALGSGRGMAFRRDALRSLGGFDHSLGPATPTLAGEDIEALLRMVLAGGEVVHEPAALVWHDHPRDYGMLRRRMWGYGLGISACLTKSVVQHPSLVPPLARRLPAGLALALSPRSAKNRGRQGDYPPELVRLELAGMTLGPFAYAMSRWQQRGLAATALGSPAAGRAG